MDTKTYIDSGILEKFVLGIASAQERQEVACMVKIYPEIREELDDLESALCKYLEDNKLNPPDTLKERILNTVKNLPDDISTNSESKVVKMHITPTKENNLAKWVAAASLVLLLVTAGMFYTQRIELQNTRGQISELSAKRNELSDKLATTNNKMDALSNELVIMKHPANQMITMKGVEKSPDALATIYWNKENHEVYLQVNKLPHPPKGMQYQLWAIVNGVPTDMGVFELTVESSELQRMLVIKGAQAFAVTLEQTGGSATPNLEAMVMVGNV